jgi:hypothetical protein
MRQAFGDGDAPSTIGPWGTAYQYLVEGKDIRVCSVGPDGERGTPDDISRP